MRMVIYLPLMVPIQRQNYLFKPSKLLYETTLSSWKKIKINEKNVNK